MKEPRTSPQTLSVLQEFIGSPPSWRYGYELGRATGLKAGTLYPILMRLAEHGLLEAQWTAIGEGAPPRHMYRLTAAGRQFAQAKLAETAPRLPLRPAAGKGRA